MEEYLRTPENLSLLEIAIRAAFFAGEEILKVYSGEISVENKADNSPLTEADKNSHLAIAKILRSTGLKILSEEGRSIPYEERKEWQEFWLIDPLDGTKEFIKRNGEFTVNIALIRDSRPVVGVIYVPVSRVLYFAAQSAGAYKIEPFHEYDMPVKDLLSASTRLPIKHPDKQIKLVCSRSHMSEETRLFAENLQLEYPGLGFTSIGSSLKFCLLAEGSATIYPRFGTTMEWDTAAGTAILEIAGGKVLQHPSNTPLTYNKPDLLNPWFVATAPLQ